MATIFRQAEMQRLVLVAGIATLIILSFMASFSSIWALWQTSDHRHGLLVFPITAFLVWQQRQSLADAAIGPDARGLIVIVPLALGWISARLAGVQVIEHAAVLAMIPAAVATFAGVGLTRRILFPLSFLLLATPLGDGLVPLLMVVTADISTALLKISGFPVFRDGQYISLPGGEFVVADVCSGLRYLITGVMISLLYGYLTYSQLRKRILIVLITAVTLVVANGVRAYIVMAVASATEMKYFGGRDHIYFGWLLFGIVMMAVMWIGTRYADEIDEDSGSPPTPSRESVSALPMIVALGLMMLAVTVMPFRQTLGQTGVLLVAVAALAAFVWGLLRLRTATRHAAANELAAAGYIKGAASVVTLVAGAAILIVTPRLAASVEYEAEASIHAIDLAATIPCARSGAWNEPWQPVMSQPDFETSAAFDCDGQPVSVYVASYASALQGRELVSSSHVILPEDWDRITDLSRLAIAEPAGGRGSVVVARVEGRTYRATVWYWYEVDGAAAAAPLATKARQMIALLRGRPAGGRMVVVAAPDVGEREASELFMTGLVDGLLGAGENVPAAGLESEDSP